MTVQNITLRSITQDNWQECIRLTVTDEQKPFVAPNIYSLAEAKVMEVFVPLAIYSDEKMVGFTMYGTDNSDSSMWIIRLMIDKAYQKNGYGRKALELLIEKIRIEFYGKPIYIGFNPRNDVARKLYVSVGFRDTRKIEDGELIYRLEA